ncbi:MAG TPA: hypothetical protein VFV34_17015, partial [Blastocatellia bacterium]|nr:hypothetical protein [Blastocatellia bacterium]
QVVLGAPGILRGRQGETLAFVGIHSLFDDGYSLRGRSVRHGGESLNPYRVQAITGGPLMSIKTSPAHFGSSESVNDDGPVNRIIRLRLGIRLGLDLNARKPANSMTDRLIC